MTGFLPTYLIVYFTLAAGFAGLVAYLARDVLSKGRRAWLGAAVLVVALALTPIPIHGGFLLLLPELISEGLRERQVRNEQARETTVRARLDDRFEGYLPDAVARAHWRDTSTGLVWTDRIGVVPSFSPESLAVGRRLCRTLEPAGHWDLPRSAEFYYLERAGRLEGAWIADAFVMPGEIPLPALISRRAGPMSGGEIPLRCVGVTPPAPRGGYLTSDIPLPDWNRFQLGQ